MIIVITILTNVSQCEELPAIDHRKQFASSVSFQFESIILSGVSDSMQLEWREYYSKKGLLNIEQELNRELANENLSARKLFSIKRKINYYSKIRGQILKLRQEEEAALDKIAANIPRDIGPILYAVRLAPKSKNGKLSVVGITPWNLDASYRGKNRGCDSVIEYLRGFKDLQYLDLCYTEMKTNSANKLKWLDKLLYLGCPGSITDKEVSIIITNSPSLKYLVFSNCRFIKGEFSTMINNDCLLREIAFTDSSFSGKYMGELIKLQNIVCIINNGTYLFLRR